MVFLAQQKIMAAQAPDAGSRAWAQNRARAGQPASVTCWGLPTQAELHAGRDGPSQAKQWIRVSARITPLNEPQQSSTNATGAATDW